LNPPLVVVVDAMVVVSGVTGDPEGPSAAILDAVSTGEVRLAISDDQLSELVRVFRYPEIEERLRKPVRAFEAALDIGYMGIMHHPRRLDWPSLRDPKDSWILDLAHIAGADYIVSYDSAVRDGGSGLRVRVARVFRDSRIFNHPLSEME
jgi:putative PIN family toxin of toxin-antitoxin system